MAGARNAEALEPRLLRAGDLSSPVWHPMKTSGEVAYIVGGQVSDAAASAERIAQDTAFLQDVIREVEGVIVGQRVNSCSIFTSLCAS